MSDKRSQQRKSCNTRIDILDAETGEVIGSLVNISLSGFMMITAKALPENYVFQFKIVLHPSGTEKQAIQIGAESLWTQEVAESTKRWMGFHIIDISEQDQEKVIQLIGDWRDEEPAGIDYLSDTYRLED